MSWLDYEWHVTDSAPVTGRADSAILFTKEENCSEGFCAELMYVYIGNVGSFYQGMQLCFLR